MRLSPKELSQLIDLHKKTQNHHDGHNYNLSIEQEKLIFVI